MSDALNIRAFARPQPEFAVIGIMMALTLMLTVPAYFVEARVFQGSNVWLKTIKFQLSLAVYFLSLVYFARWAEPELLASRRFRTFAKVVCAMTVAEMVWIGGGSMFAVASHYNDTSLIMAMIYPVMGVFAVTLTVASFVLGRSILRNRAEGLDPAVRLSIGLSLILTCVLTVIAAGTLSSQTGHTIGAVTTGATVPLFGWSREAGDLRMAHFFATHAMHVLPLVGVLSRWLARPELRRAAAVLAAIAYTGFVGVCFVLAVLGMPFFPV